MSHSNAISARVRPLRKRFALGAFSLAISYALAETACRLLIPAGPADPLAGADRPATFFRVDPERQPLAAVPDADAFRIAVIGDSFTVGVGVQTTDCYAAQLERMLNARAGLRPVKVKLFAHAGTGTYQQLRFLKEALRWKPDLVVLGICLNDTEDPLKPDQIAEWRRDMLPPPPGPRLAALLRHSVLLSAVYRGWAVRAARRGFAGYYRRIYDPEYSGWVLFRVGIKKFRATCANEGVSFLAMILPLMNDPFEKGRYRFEFAHEAIHELMEGNGVDYLDELEAFRGKNPQRMTVVPVLDPHPSEIAHRIIAETLLDGLVAHGYLPEDYRLVEYGAGITLRAQWKRTSELMDPLRPQAKGKK